MPQHGMFGFGMPPNQPWGPGGGMPHNGHNLNSMPPQQMIGGPIVG